MRVAPRFLVSTILVIPQIVGFATRSNRSGKMSFQAMTWAVTQPLPPFEKLTILMLANYANAEGVCWPSIRRLCIDTGMSRATLCKCLLNLEKKKLIARKRRLRKSGNQSTMYRLDMTVVDTGISSLTVNLMDEPKLQ